MALAMNFPRKRNLEHTSSTMLKRVEGPRGQGKSPTGLYAYSGVLEAPVSEVRGREGGEEVRENLSYFFKHAELSEAYLARHKHETCDSYFEQLPSSLSPLPPTLSGPWHGTGISSPQHQV